SRKRTSPGVSSRQFDEACRAEVAEQRRRMSARLADLIYRFRLPLCAGIVVGFLGLLPLTNVTVVDNDISMWISRDDPLCRTHARFREECGAHPTLLIALRSERLFTPEGLAFVRQITDDIQRVDLVERVYRLSTANIVANLPATPDDDGGIEVQPLLDRVLDEQAASRVRARV